MRTHARLLAVGTLVLALGCWFLAAAADGQGAKAIELPDDDFKLLVESSNKVIQDSLAGNPDKRAKLKASTAAIYIALYAQADPKTSVQQRATVRDGALKVIDLIKNNQIDDAKKQAADLSTMKANPAAKPGAVVKLGKQVELDEVMMYFHRIKLGGTDVEFKLLEMGTIKEGRQKKALPANRVNDDTLIMAYQIAIVTDFVKEHEPLKMPKAWPQLAASAHANALDLAKAIKADKGKDSKDAWTALNKLNGSCTECHTKCK